MNNEGPERSAITHINVGGRSLTPGELIEELVGRVYRRVYRLESEVGNLTVRVAEL